MTPFEVVLLEPEIPQNTGTIGRLCLATGARLHLVEPLGFELSESRLRRAGLDYWEHLTVVRHASIDAFLAGLPPEAPLVFLENRSGNSIYQHRFAPGSYLIFGKETFGIPDWVTSRYADRTLTIPMFDARVRSLNLAQSVAIVLYEGIRQGLSSS